MTEQKSNVQLGIFFMLMAMFIFAIVNAGVKAVSQDYGVWQILFCRFFFALIPALYLIKKDGGVKLLRPQKFPLLAGIGIFGSFAVYVLFYAFRIGDLAEVTALAYSSIIFLTALSVPLLREAVGWRRWLAVLVGFSGILLMASPGTEMRTGSLLGIVFAFMDAMVMIGLRIATRDNRTSTVVFYTALFASLTSVPFLISEFIMPQTWEHIGILLFLGLGGGIGQIMLTNAYRLAPAVAVAPMIYTAMIWGAAFGILFFGEQLTVHLIVGGLIVVMCGIYIIYRENVEKNQTLQPRDGIID